MREAYSIATRDAWAELHQFALTRGLTVTVLGKFGDALFSYMDHLTDEVSVGYRSGRNALDRDSQRAHEQLLAALLTAADFTEVQRLAFIAAWPLPTQLVVFAGVVPTETPLPDAVLFESDLLARIERPVSVLACDAAYVSEARREAWGAFDNGHLAVSWPVSLDEVSDALRWTTRALELAQLGVLEANGVINCEDHLLALWLYAEPRLRQRVCHNLLGPLLAEAPHNREVLSATLLRLARDPRQRPCPGGAPRGTSAYGPLSEEAAPGHVRRSTRRPRLCARHSPGAQGQHPVVGGRPSRRGPRRRQLAGASGQRRFCEGNPWRAAGHTAGDIFRPGSASIGFLRRYS